ncbi:MAG: carboxypeptidase regulatory-like domain-containing protein, partial [Bacteroidetes bacterium]|nr:carboxypeptidase regulatory-like domain-containing protein [Bacteroidota bacterium]
MKRSLAFLLCLGALTMGLPSLTLAQSASITGTVTAADTGEPLGGANVVVRQPGLLNAVTGAATDDDGQYTIEGLWPDT